MSARARQRASRLIDLWAIELTHSRVWTNRGIPQIARRCIYRAAAAGMPYVPPLLLFSARAWTYYYLRPAARGTEARIDLLRETESLLSVSGA